jgi:hypothetical protein
MHVSKSDELFIAETRPFELAPDAKDTYLNQQLIGLLDHHRKNCDSYDQLIRNWSAHRAIDGTLATYPYFPVNIFKEFELKSTDNAVSVVESSSTTSNNASKIYIDKQSRKRQSKSANSILGDFVGSTRKPYIVFDVEETVRGSKGFSARGAAILSLAHLATKFYFVMKDTGNGLQVDFNALEEALQEIGDEPFLSYGFTFILFQAHQQITETKWHHRAHPESRFLHSGGWKKLTELAVEKPLFNTSIATPWDLSPNAVIDFYGTVEQIGMAYPDCSEGFKHVPYWADVLMRRSDSLEVCSPGEEGLIQLISALPMSAPNHSVLTEDIGELVLEDDCPCGRRGRAFVFRGRAPRSESRGCSDVVRR